MLRAVQRGRRAFTLIELLVVVSIIALLVSILMPALSKARDAGMRAVCISHLKALGLACYTYADENRGDLPEAYCVGYHGTGKGLEYTGNGAVFGFHRLIWNGYIEPESPLWACPGDRDPIVVVEETNYYPHWTMPKGAFSYCWNALLGFRSLTDYGEWWVVSPGPGSYNVDTSDSPAQVAVLRDRYATPTPETKLHMYSGMVWYSTQRYQWTSNHQSQGYNTLFADSHVVWVDWGSAGNVVLALGPMQYAPVWNWHW